MTRSLTLRPTLVLAGLLAALALLLAGPLAGDAAAITKAQQVNKAAGQASFFCYAWQCREKLRRVALFSGGTFRTLWKLTYPHHILGHGNCTSYALMSIDVTATGRVVSRMVRCG